jgi:PAS domain S-box-containing protein
MANNLVYSLIVIIGTSVSFLFYRLRTEVKNLKKEVAVLREDNLRYLHIKERLAGIVHKQKEVLENVSEGILGLNGDSIYFANQCMAEMLGFSNAQQLEGKSIQVFLQENDKAKFRKIIEEKLQVEIAVMVFRGQTKYFTGEVHFFEVPHQTGNQYMMIVKDMATTVKLLELQTNILKKKEEDRNKSQTLADVIHELKTPINVIYSALQLEQNYIQEKDWGGIEKYNPRIIQNCNRLIRLINNFIDVSRFEQNEVSTVFNYVNLVTVAEEITDSVLSFAEAKDIKVIFDTQQEELYAEVDLQLLDRAMLNLLSNAIKYNKKGGQIIVNVEACGDYIKISVTDTGLGIPKEKIHILSNRFERVDKLLAKEKEGSGLGLNIVKNIVELMKGYMDIESTLGEGTTVMLYLPSVNQAFIPSAENLVVCNKTLLEKSVEMEFSDIKATT